MNEWMNEWMNERMNESLNRIYQQLFIVIYKYVELFSFIFYPARLMRRISHYDKGSRIFFLPSSHAVPLEIPAVPRPSLTAQRTRAGQSVIPKLSRAIYLRRTAGIPKGTAWKPFLPDLILYIRFPKICVLEFFIFYFRKTVEEKTWSCLPAFNLLPLYLCQ